MEDTKLKIVIGELSLGFVNFRDKKNGSAYSKLKYTYS